MVNKIPKQLKDLKFCRVRYKTKKPFEKDWTKKPYPYEEISKFENENYGVLCGYNNLAVIDCDREELALAIKTILPKTFSVKTGGGGTHFYYFIPELKKKIILNAGEEHLGEVQSHGTQVIGAGSLHPNNKTYEIIDDVEIKEISLKELYSVIENFISEEEETEKRKETGELTKLISSEIDFKKLLDGYGLKKKGENYNCPFHKSEGGQCLSVDENKGIFNCFHCGRKGNIISFVSDLEGITIKQAIKKIKGLVSGGDKKAKKEYGVQIKCEGAIAEENIIENELFKLRSEILSLIINDKRGEAVEKAVENICAKNKFYAIRDDKTDEIWKYDKGVFVPHGASYVREFVRRVLAENYTVQFSNQVLDRIKVDNFIRKEDFFKNNYPNEMVVENGILNVQTRELKKYSPDKIFFTKLDFPYEPEAKCPKIEKFFNEILGDQKTSMYEVGGDCLQKSYKFKKLFVQEGAKDTAKTTTQSFIARFIGENNISNVPLKRLTEDKYSLGELHNMLLNTCGEITEKFLGNIDNVKLLTGEDRVSVMRKFLTDLKFLNHAKLMFACNDLPIINTDLAMWNRFIILRYKKEFIDKEEHDKLPVNKRANKGIKDRNILNKICTKEEFSGFLNKCLEGLKRLEKKGYSNTKTAEENKMYWIRKSDSFQAFCLDNIEEDVEESINKKDLDRQYNKYCSKNKIKRLSKKHSRFILETEYCANDNQETGGLRVWEGVKFKEISEPEEPEVESGQQQLKGGEK